MNANQDKIEKKTFVIKETKHILHYSSYVNMQYEGDRVYIRLGKDKNGTPLAATNMQTDKADFEALAFAIWSEVEETKIVLAFEPYEAWNHEFPLRAINGNVSSECMHYMRFLYRVNCLLTEREGYFEVAKQNQQEVEIFAGLFANAKVENQLYITTPEAHSGVNVKIENQLEKWFAYASCKEDLGKLSELVPEFERFKGMQLYDQFPCGLFYGDKAEENRIFNAGAFDLFGVDEEGHYCLFELKKLGNNGLGIISELYFYAHLYRELKAAKPVGPEDMRGFDLFKAAKTDCVKAFFLVPQVNEFFRDKRTPSMTKLKKLTDILEKASGGKIKYEFIIFDQKEIVNQAEMLSGKPFKEAIETVWKDFQYQ